METYNIALICFFFTYSTFDIPANMLLKRLRPSVWLPTITLVSGVVTIGMGFTKNEGQLIATRVLLGMVECGLFPGVAYVITIWYRKSEAQFRQALFFCAASMAGAFAGLLAVGLHAMDGVGGLPGFRWIFIIEGLATIVVAGIAYFVVLDYPSTAKFLTDAERHELVHRLELDEFGEDEDLLTKEEKEALHAHIPRSTIFKSVFSDWHIYAHILVFYGISVPLYSISLSLPSIIQALGYTATNANFLTVPIYVTACIISLGVAFLSDRKNIRFYPLITSFIVMFTGFLIALVRPMHLPGLAYAGVFIAACGIYPAFPGMITFASNNLASAKKRSIAMALHIGMGSFGGAMGPSFFRSKDNPHYRLGFGLNLAFVTMGGIAATAIWHSYLLKNRERRRKCGELERLLEAEVEKVDGETAAKRRHAFLVEKEEDLAMRGDRSVWFRYTL